MSRLPSVEIGIGILVLTVWSAGAAPKPDPRPIHDSALVIDGHADTPQRFLDEGFDIATDTPVSEGHLDLGKARAGNLGAEFFSIWVDPKPHVGRFLGRSARSQGQASRRPYRFRSTGGSRNEPTRNDRRYLARLGQNLLRCS